jgi:hypothetical protein
MRIRAGDLQGRPGVSQRDGINHVTGQTFQESTKEGPRAEQENGLATILPPPGEALFSGQRLSLPPLRASQGARS